jgi:PAS domain S-box-containing protein
LVESLASSEFEQIRVSHETLARTNRALQMLSACSDIVIRAMEENRLLAEVCRAIVEIGGYPLAWIGEAESDAGRSVRPVAIAGDGDDYVRSARISWGDNERGRGPAGIAIRSGQIVVSRDTTTDPGFAPWRQRAAAKGYLSMATMPLSAGGFTGALMVYASKRDAFDEAEIALLGRLAGNLAHGIAALRAKAAEQAGEARYRQLVEMMSEGLGRTDEHWVFTYVNPALCQQLGYSSDELIGRRMMDLRAEPGGPRADSRRAARRAGTGERYEMSMRHRDGRIIPMLVSAQPVLDSAGRLTGIIGVTTDLTALRQAEVRAQQYLDVAAALITVLDIDGTVRLLNRRACEILGVAEAAAVGRSWYETFVPEDRRAAEWAEFAAFVAGRRASSEYIETHVRNSRGEIRLIAWRDILLRGDDGRPTGVLSSGEDITERRSTELKRDEFKALLEATADASPDGIVITDLAGCYLFWNRRFADLWGLSESYLQHRAGPDGAATPALVVRFTAQTADPQAHTAAVERAYRGEAAASGEEIALKDGRTIVRHVARVRFGAPASTAIAWVYRDVTEQKRREAELAQSQRLNAIGQLAGGVAHDFNNLLMVIGGNLELIKDRLGGDARVGDFTQAALAAVETAAGLTQRLLSFSRRQPLTPRPIDVNLLLADVLKLLPRLLGRTVELDFTPQPGTWPVAVDPGQLQNAVINLAINARDAMPRGGRVTIAVDNKALERPDAAGLPDLPPGEYVLIAVGDEGLGMRPEIAKRAFEPFFTTKPEGQGTGLGLSMVFGFVKQSGGHVALESAQGRGTTVRIHLPRARAREGES